jgi:hypothetical protein
MQLGEAGTAQHTAVTLLLLFDQEQQERPRGDRSISPKPKFKRPSADGRRRTAGSGRSLFGAFGSSRHEKAAAEP